MKWQYYFVFTFLLVFASHAKEKLAPGETRRDDGQNKVYGGNRKPLLPSAFIKLPVGAIQPDAWIRQQLLLMSEGFTGRLPEISKWCKFEGSAWASSSGEGKYGWEEMPYWLKGFTDLGYVLQEERIIAEARKWIDAILASQRENGYFGSKENLEKVDIWPNMIVLYALRSHLEATGDTRVLPFMSRYFKWLSTVPMEKYLPGSWQKWRGGDNLDSVYWLYNRTGERWLLELGRINHERTADWTGGVPTWHGVNLTQGFREPAQFYQQSRDIRHLQATVRNYDTIMETYGQAPGGMFGADENARKGYTSPRQAAESCSMVEFMWSHEMLLGITGDAVWADRCEEIAFNSLPAAMTPDFKGLHYLTAPNQIQLDRTNKAPMIENSGDMFSYNPHNYRCCQHNVAFGWPYFVEHLWMATPDHGLAATMYGPCTVRAKVADGKEVTISESTEYPFDEHITFIISPSSSVRFPLLLRVPGWCKDPSVTVNNLPVDPKMHSKGWLSLTRYWHKGDHLKLHLPMTLSVKTWPQNKNAVSVHRGPLAFALKIGERWHRYGGTDRWPAFEVYASTPWNYALVANVKEPEKSFSVKRCPRSLAAQPFTLEHAAVTIKAKGKRIPQWKQESNGLIAELQDSPASSDEPIEDITLVPMGAARLRITAFPHSGDGPEARSWK